MSELGRYTNPPQDDSTRLRYPRQTSDSPSQDYLPTEEATNINPMGANESEGPTQSLLHQSVTEISDSGSCFLKESNIGGHVGSDDGNSDRVSKGRSETFKDWFTNSWFTEILAVLVSFTCAIAIPVVLGIYNHNPVPRLPWDISLNTLVSVLSTVAKSSLLYAICAALGQDKWDWYDTGAHGPQRETHVKDRRSIISLSQGTERRLKDMETLDQASRGPLGAIKFLTSRRTAFSPTSLGALVIILSLVVDPFTQQVVSLRERRRLVPSDEVWTPQASAPFFCYADSHIDKSGKALTDCGNIFRDAHYSAIWEPEGYKHPTHAHCPSGNCEWEPFYTIEYCVDNQVIQSPTGYCDISFNRSEFDEAYAYYNDTGKSRIKIQECSHIIEPLKLSPYTKPQAIDVDAIDDSGFSFGTQTTFPNSTDFNYLAKFGTENSIVTGFQLFEKWDNLTDRKRVPRFLTRFPTEVISPLSPYANNNVTDESGARIPNPLVTMAHTRYEMTPKPFTSRDRVGGSHFYTPTVELRVNLTEWSALSLCQVERKITVVNGSTNSTVTASKYLHHGSRPQELRVKSGDGACYAPEDHIDVNGTLSAKFSHNITGSFSIDDTYPRNYAANVSAGAFCVHNGTMEYDPSSLLTQALRGTKSTDAEGQDVVGFNGQVWNYKWEKRLLDDGEDITVRGTRIAQRTLPAIMTSIAAGLNNINYAATNETVTGSYVLHEIILVARWGWLSVLFSIELMGMGYLLYIIFRPRSAAGVWKDSIFAVLYHGLDEGARNTIGHVKNLRDMRKATEYMEVRLDHPREDDRAVLVREF